MKSHPALLLCGVVILGGCSWWKGMDVRSQSPDEFESGGPNVRLVSDLAVPFGMFPVEVEGVGLVTELRGTGSDAVPSKQRDLLASEMKVRGVKSPDGVLASPDTAMVMIRGVLPPGIQRGDSFDIEIRLPAHSETSSLQGGWLLSTRLKEYAVLNNQIHGGHVLGIAEGPILVEPSAEESKNRVLMGRGRILGGGVAQKTRPLALVLKPDRQSARNSARVEAAVNKRFYTPGKGSKSGVAKAMDDRYIELTVFPKYKNNIPRYMQVVRSIALRESESVRQQRLDLLERQLLDPITSSRATLQLEAIGSGEAIEILRKGMAVENRETRFFSAEAMAYLDQSEAAEALAEAARETPAFRVFALAALAVMDDVAATQQLRELLNGSSVETRYGAFRALWTMSPNDPVVMGEPLGEQFSYHVLNTTGTPMIHLTRSRRPEVVLFGVDQRFKTPLALEAGNQIMIVSTEPGKIAVSKFAVGQMNQRRIASDRVDDVIRAVVELGGTYPDVVQALQEAKRQGVITSRLEVDALPEGGRTYDRLADGSYDTRESGENATKLSNSSEKPHPTKNFFAKMMGGGSR